jgi:hypothetical protein
LIGAINEGEENFKQANLNALLLFLKYYLMYWYFGLFDLFNEVEKFFKFNPNPLSFEAITKLTASGCKEPPLPHPMHSTVGGPGEGGCFPCRPKICLINASITVTL